MNREPLLSICIPTYNRCDYLYHTLLQLTGESIFKNTNDIEIIISDNCSTDNTKHIVGEFLQKYPTKIRYIRQEEPLFAPLNIYGVLDYADGKYLKLQNDNLYFVNNGLSKLIELIKIQQADITFCANKSVNSIDKIETINELVSNISYNSTWMGAYCFKKEAYQKLDNPHKCKDTWMTSVDVFFRMLENGASVICYNEQILENQKNKKKGASYNVAEVFGKHYLELLQSYVERGILSPDVFEKEKKQLLLNHINKYCFDFDKKYTFEKDGYNKYLFNLYKYNPYYYFSYIGNHLRLLSTFFLNVTKDNKYQKIKLLGFIKINLKRKKQSSWRLINSHNKTHLLMPEIQDNVVVGNHSYGNIDAFINYKSKLKLRIGHFCSIADGVKFLVSSEHPYDGISTYPFNVMMFDADTESIGKGDIVIKDDVWIATNAIILSMVTIEQGAIVGAGSVVTKDVPPYAIVAGNPARIIKYRFEPEIIEKLIAFDYSKLTEEKAQKIGCKIYKKITKENVDEMLKELQSSV